MTPVIGAAVVTLKDVGCALFAVTVDVGLVCPDDDRVPADGHRAAKVVPCRTVAGGELGHLPPIVGAAVAAFKDVGCTLPAVAASIGPHHDCVPADRHGDAEQVPRRAVGGGELFHLTPVVGAAVVGFKDVGCALTSVAADISVVCPDDDRISADCHGNAEQVLRRAVAGGQLGDLGGEQGV